MRLPARWEMILLLVDDEDPRVFGENLLRTDHGSCQISLSWIYMILSIGSVGQQTLLSMFHGHNGHRIPCWSQRMDL